MPFGGRGCTPTGVLMPISWHMMSWRTLTRSTQRTFGMLMICMQTHLFFHIYRGHRGSGDYDETIGMPRGWKSKEVSTLHYNRKTGKPNGDVPAVDMLDYPICSCVQAKHPAKKLFCEYCRVRRYQWTYEEVDINPVVRKWTQKRYPEARNYAMVNPAGQILLPRMLLRTRSQWLSAPDMPSNVVTDGTDGDGLPNDQSVANGQNGQHQPQDAKPQKESSGTAPTAFPSIPQFTASNRPAPLTPTVSSQLAMTAVFSLPSVTITIIKEPSPTGSKTIILHGSTSVVSGLVATIHGHLLQIEGGRRGYRGGK